MNSRTSLVLALGTLALLRPPAMEAADLSGPLPPIPAKSGASAVAPPPPPIPVSPVNTFRELLALPAAEREKSLSIRPESQRESLRLRLAEYERLNPVEREERLNATDLYWHLQQLLRRSPAERSGLLAHVPESLRNVLSQRLALWDQLPASEQEILLQHERTVRYLARLRQIQVPPLPGTNALPPTRTSASFEGEIARLGNLTPSEFQRLHEQWRRFFEVPSPVVHRTLKAMSEAERTEMSAVLDRFRQLSPEQRRTCIDSFTRLAILSPADRAIFLRSAERWESLPAEERSTWRRLVRQLPIFPPLPTDHSAPPLPPTSPKRELLSEAARK